MYSVNVGTLRINGIWVILYTEGRCVVNSLGPFEGERLEDLQLAGMCILQKDHGFRFGMDSVLLADFVRMGRHDKAADFGTGSGVLPFLLLGRDKGLSFEAFEIQPEMADMAARSVALNGLSDRIRVHCMDVADAHTLLGYETMDAVVCNPPYGLPGSAMVNPDPVRAVSRHQQDEGLLRFLKAAFRVLRVRGRFSMIYPAQRMLEAMEQMDSVRLTPKRLRMVYPSRDKAANLVLIEAQKEAGALLHQEPPLIIREMDGSESEELRRIYHMEREA